MRLRPEQLGSHLEQDKSAPIYLITGDEPLQKKEAMDALRKNALKAGFDERNLLEVSRHFDWNNLFQQADSLSLFSSQRLIELQLGSGKPGNKGGKALVEYCDNPPADTLLIINADKIDSNSQKTKWFKALDSKGVIVQIWPVEIAALPQWIQRRFSDQGRTISREAAEYIADHVEGNMLAASQEIEVITLLTDQSRLELDDVLSVGDSSRYDVFKLVDAALSGNSERTLMIVDGLRKEGTEPIIIHWALSRELRSLYKMSKALVDGESIDAVLKKNRVWSNRTTVIRSALQRHRPPGLQILLQTANHLERIIKDKPGDPWCEINWLCLRIAGVRLQKNLLQSLSQF